MTSPLTAKSNRRFLSVLSMIWSVMWLASAAHAAAVAEVKDAWVRATVPGQKVAGAYLEIRSRSAARLVGVRSPAAKSAEIHSMSNDGGVMKMRHLDALALPAGQSVRLEPNGNHIMLFDIKQPLEAGARVPLTLIIEQNGKKKSLEVQAEVRAVSEYGRGSVRKPGDQLVSDPLPQQRCRLRGCILRREPVAQTFAQSAEVNACPHC
jgi:copper(I)-binding protein